MESEKVKEILKFCSEGKDCYDGCPYKHDTHCVMKISKQALTLINKLESDNAKLKQHKRELEGGQRDLLKVIKEFDKENQQLKDRIAELESENDEQYKRIMELEQDLVHADEKVFYRECNVTLRENEIKEQALNKFAERLKEQIKAIAKWYDDHADKTYNGIREKDIDETLKEFI